MARFVSEMLKPGANVLPRAWGQIWGWVPDGQSLTGGTSRKGAWERRHGHISARAWPGALQAFGKTKSQKSNKKKEAASGIGAADAQKRIQTRA